MNVALFQKGFRPFFLAAAAFATIWVPVWSARFSSGWAAAWSGPNWHAHEMIFGFFVAVIVGFLLTSVENWTQEKTVTPKQLAFLVVLWMAGRVVMIAGEATQLGALVDLALIPFVTFFVARPIIKTKNRRNYVIPFILTALFLLNLISHLAPMLGHPELARNALLTGIYVVVGLVLMIGGRVIPFFTANATGKLTSSNPKLERALMIGALGLVLVQGFSIPWISGAWMIVLGLATLVRMKNWQTPVAMRIPILAILHVGHIWLGLGLITRGLSDFVPAITPNLGLHILTIGGLSTICLGMMARVSLGHTGRKITATPSVVTAFVLLNLAVVVRGILPIFAPAHYVSLVIAGSAIWATSFAIYLFKYTPVLILSRADGRPG